MSPWVTGQRRAARTETADGAMITIRGHTASHAPLRTSEMPALTGRHASDVLPRSGPASLLSQFLSHSPPVRDRSPVFAQMVFVQVADGGGRR